MTFSIIAYDPQNEMIGSAVASMWTGVGGCVPFFRSGTGFVNTQNFASAVIAHKSLDYMEKGLPLGECIEKALREDKVKEQRQILAGTMTGEFYVYSGEYCSEVFYHKLGLNCVAAGNTLVSSDVIEAMVRSFEEEGNAPLSLAKRLILALEAGQAAGGDRRGEEAASVKVYMNSYPDQPFLPVDLRVDSSETPLADLRELYRVFCEKEQRIMY